MPRPVTPAAIGRIPLGIEATAFLNRLIDTIYVVDTLRPAKAILAQSVAGFRLAWQQMGGAWVPRILIQLTPELVMRNPAASLE